MTKQEIFEEAHKALHNSKAISFRLGGLTIPIQVAKNGCRCIRLNDIQTGSVTIMEQNPKTGSPYAQRTRKGETISWVMPKDDNIWTPIETPLTAKAVRIQAARNRTLSNIPNDNNE